MFNPFFEMLIPASEKVPASMYIISPELMDAEYCAKRYVKLNTGVDGESPLPGEFTPTYPVPETIQYTSLVVKPSLT
jgi:hypothetical protein